MNPKVEPGHGAQCIRHEEKIAQGERERKLMWKKVDGIATDVSYIRGRIDTALKTNGSGARHPPSPPAEPGAGSAILTPRGQMLLLTIAGTVGGILTYITGILS